MAQLGSRVPSARNSADALVNDYLCHFQGRREALFDRYSKNAGAAAPD